MIILFKLDVCECVCDEWVGMCIYACVEDYTSQYNIVDVSHFI